MQNDPNNRPYYYTAPRVAGRLIGKKPSNIGLWTLFRQQKQGIQIGIISIGALLTVLLILLPFAVFSDIFANNTTIVQNVQTTTDQNQNITATTSAVLATDTPAATATALPTSSPITSQQAIPTPLAVDRPVTSNPWGYDFSPGSFITAPPTAFCTYFTCINGFWNGQGYAEECQDGMFTLGGGVGGDCDAHGGDLRPLYYHPALNAPLPTATPTPAPQITPTPTLKVTPTPTPKPKKSKATPTTTH